MEEEECGGGVDRAVCCSLKLLDTPQLEVIHEGISSVFRALLRRCDRASRSAISNHDRHFGLSARSCPLSRPPPNSKPLQTFFKTKNK